MKTQGFDVGDMLDDRLAIVGRAGYGKTNAAKVGVESLLKLRRRVCILDPTDAWFGLRVKPDGKTPAFPVVIFGGEHGDLPINEHAGAVLGEAVAKSSESCIISIADFIGENARRRFASDFLRALYQHNKAPLHLIVDEADIFAPQKPMTPGDNILLATLSQIVRRGRRKGFVPWLISQRPAVINKDVLSQADVLCSFNLTSSQDRNAIKGWIEGQGDKAFEKELLATLPKMPRGEGYLWAPGRSILERRHFPLSSTFDSGKTLTHGAKGKAVKLVPLDVDKLAGALKSVVDEKAANDPKALRARIAELERAAKAAPDLAGVSSEALRQARAAAYAGGMYEGYAEASRLFGPPATQFGIANELLEKAKAASKSRAEQLRQTTTTKPANNIETSPPTAAHVAREATRPADYQWKATLNLGKVKSASDGTKVRPGERAILTVLAQSNPEPVKASRVAAICNMSVDGGTFKTYAGNLRRLGLVEPGQPMAITPAGLSALGEFERLPTGPALLEKWKKELRPGEAKLLDAIASGATMPADIGQATDIAPEGGTYKTYMGRLKRLGLVTGDGRNGFELQEDLR